jgi:hypothetical protein
MNVKMITEFEIYAMYRHRRISNSKVQKPAMKNLLISLLVFRISSVNMLFLFV